jgi:hypothetical protein
MKFTFKSILLLVTSFVWPVVGVTAADLVIPVTEVTVISSSGVNSESKILIKFDLTSIPQRSFIDFAGLNFKLETDTSMGDIFEFVAYPLVIDWDVRTAKWALLQNVAGDVYIDTLVSSGLLNRHEREDVYLDITSLVRGWVSGKIDNRGVILQGSTKNLRDPKLTSDSNFVNNAIAQVKIFYTSPDVKK